MKLIKEKKRRQKWILGIERGTYLHMEQMFKKCYRLKFTSGHDEVTWIRFAFPHQIGEKLNKIHETTIFRAWTTDNSGQWSFKKGKQIRRVLWML